MRVSFKLYRIVSTIPTLEQDLIYSVFVFLMLCYYYTSMVFKPVFAVFRDLNALFDK